MIFQQIIDDQKDELLQSLQRCIRFPSVYSEDGSGHPYGRKVHECLCDTLAQAEEMGLSTGMLDGHVGWAEYGNGSEMVMAVGHLDVVPECDGWTMPAFEGIIRNERIYARGSIDDKGGCIAALYALKAIKDSGLPLKRRIRVMFGTNEEKGSNDLKYYLAHGGEIPVSGFTPDGEFPVTNAEKGAINHSYTFKLSENAELRLVEMGGGKATNCVADLAWAVFECSSDLAEKIVRLKGEKIHCERTANGVKITADGISAHGSTPQLGENAIGRLMIFLKALPVADDLKQAVVFIADKIGMDTDCEKLGMAVSDDISGALTMNMGLLSGDHAQITLWVNLRFPVTKDSDAIQAKLKRAFEDAGFEQSSARCSRAIYYAPDSAVVKKLYKAFTDVTGKFLHLRCMTGGTYAKIMPNILAFGPIFPDAENLEHCADEYIEIKHLIQCAKIYAEALYALAGE